MESALQVVVVLLTVFIAALTRSALGFGDAMLAMPVLALAVGMRVATPLVAFCSSTIALTLLSRGWRTVDFRATWRLTLSSLAGIPIGLYFLTSAPEHVVKVILGLSLIAYVLYSLTSP